MARRKSLFKFKLRKQTVYSLVSIGLFATALLILVSFIIPTGQFLERVNAFFSGHFGWARLLFVFSLVQIAMMLSKIKSGISKPNVILGYFLISFSIMGLSTSGTFGEGVFKAIYSVVPIDFVVLILFLILTLFGTTILLNLSVGELMEIVGDVLSTIKDFFGGFAKLAPKKSPVFVKDNTFQAEDLINKDTSLPKQSPKPTPNLNDTDEVSEDATQIRKPIQNPNPQLHNQSLANLGEAQLIQNSEEETKLWEYPTLSLFSDTQGAKADRGDVNHNASIIEKTLEAFGITARVAEVNKGPAVTQYALEIAVGTKLSKIVTLQNDLALALAAPGQIRIEAPIPGRSLVGIEIPNRSAESVTIRQMLDSTNYQNSKGKLTVALGLNVSGQPQVADIAKMPHVLIAGSTGSGKSVAINAFLASLLYRNSPAELKLILVDPKRVELSLYNGIPHLLTPVIVEVDKVLSALKWATSEMERRYKLFASVGVRNMEGYNEMAGFQALPYIVIVIDEMADVMMFAAVEVEDAICRLAQMARATGIHLVLSTQRPSVDVITGLIKANIPCRVAFNVTSMIDSRVIIDGPGAEKLLGRGDMLYIPPDQSKPSRVQGAFISDAEVHRLVDFLKARGGPAQYTEEVTNMPSITYKTPGAKGQAGNSSGGDAFLDEAIRIVVSNQSASASLLQRKLSVGYARAARIIDILQELQIVGAQDGSKPREVLIKNADEYFASRNQTANPSANNNQ